MEKNVKIIYVHDANIVFEVAKDGAYEAYSVIVKNGKPASVATYKNGEPIVFDWELIGEDARKQIEALLPNEELRPQTYYAVMKEIRQDFYGETTLLAVASTMELAKQRFDSAVKTEKERQKKFDHSYDTVEESEITYLAYDNDYEAPDSISIFIREAPFVG